MSTSPLHRAQDAADGNHIVQRYIFLNAADRIAFTNEQSGNPYNLLAPTAADIGAVARQTDDNSFWILTGIGPISWTQVSAPATVLTNYRASFLLMGG